MSHPRQRLRDRARGQAQRGTETLTVAILGAVAIAALFGFIVLTGRTGSAQIGIHEAAQAASRAATLTDNSADARSAARAAAQAALARGNQRCTSSTVTITTDAFHVPPGQAATVQARVSCQVPLTTVLPGVPGSRTFTATDTSPYDTYRQRR